MLQIAEQVVRNRKDKTQLMLAALMSSNSLDRLSHASFHCADSSAARAQPQRQDTLDAGRPHEQQQLR